MDFKVLSRPAEEFGNDETLENLWDSKAIEHGDIYFNILCSVDPKILRLTPNDDVIYSHFRQDFPDLNVDSIDENDLKSLAGKAKWRPFCEKFKHLVEDYSFGTLMRADAKEEYSDKNTLLVPRIQFYAIEIARNREGVNDSIRKHFKPSLRPKKSPSNSEDDGQA